MTTNTTSQQITVLTCRDARLELAMVRASEESRLEFHSSLGMLYHERGDQRRWMTFRKD